ncbi:MAG: hypothetical protein R3E79_27860 [Caldilineaceae bacterium]
MKLPIDAIVAPAKLHSYLLVWQIKNDKSAWLATAGYQRENWQGLAQDLLKLIQTTEAVADETNRYGQSYVVSGILHGPNGKQLAVRTIWMTERETGQTKFITT